MHLLASLSTHEIKKVINFCPGLDQAKFSDLVYEIIGEYIKALNKRFLSNSHPSFFNSSEQITLAH